MYKSIDFTSLVSISYVYVPTWWMGLVLVLFVVFVATTNRLFVEDRLDFSTWILHGS